MNNNKAFTPLEAKESRGNNKKSKSLTGFTLIELVVVVGIIAILSGIIMFSVVQYVNKGKDSSLFANMAVLVPAGEIFYNTKGNSYVDFCEISNPAIKNAISQIPENNESPYHGNLGNDENWKTYGGIDQKNPAGLRCYVRDDYNAWVACAQEFASTSLAFCVDSRGVKQDIDAKNCSDNCGEGVQQGHCISQIFKCPDL